MAATRSSLRSDLSRLGVGAGDLVMAHASVRSVGRIIGGVNVLIQALFDAIGDGGTLAAYVDFEPFFDEEDDRNEIPVFDRRIARAARDHGILHEALRTWPGAVRSDHPDAGVVAIGRLAEWITSAHPLQYGYGPGSPFERIVQAEGRILMIGAPLDTITILHYAEHQSRIPGKRIRRYRRHMPGEDGPRWVAIEEFDTTEPISELLPSDCFERIARGHIATGAARRGFVGAAESFLFEAPRLVECAVDWIERTAGRGTQGET